MFCFFVLFSLKIKVWVVHIHHSSYFISLHHRASDLNKPLRDAHITKTWQIYKIAEAAVNGPYLQPHSEFLGSPALACLALPISSSLIMECRKQQSVWKAGSQSDWMSDRGRRNDPSLKRLCNAAWEKERGTCCIMVWNISDSIFHDEYIYLPLGFKGYEQKFQGASWLSPGCLTSHKPSLFHVGGWDTVKTKKINVGIGQLLFWQETDIVAPFRRWQHAHPGYCGFISG